MSDDPWAAFSPQAGADPWADFAPSKPQNWSDAPGNVGSDIVKTAGEMKDAVVGLSRGTVKATAKALTDPVGLARDVVSGAGDLVSGAAKGVTDYGKHFVEGFTDPEKERARLQAQADERKQHAIERPLSTLANIATQGVAGEVTAGRALLGAGSRVAGGVDRFAVRPATELLSGVSSEAQRLASQAGEVGGARGAAFRGNMAAPDYQGMQDNLRTGVRGAAGERATTYQSDMAAVGANNTPISYQPIRTALNDAWTEAHGPGGQFVKDPLARDAVTEMSDIVSRHFLDPSEAGDAISMDALKQRIHKVGENFPEGSNARRVVDSVYREIGAGIRSQAPEYGGAMDRYQGASRNINEVVRSLGANEGATRFSTAGKLLSSLRSDASVARGARGEALADVARHAPTLPFQVAGATMNPVLPRGIVARGGALLHAGAVGGAAAFLPQLLATMPLLAAASPRAVGNARYAAGAATRGARSVGVTHNNIGKAVEALRLLSQKNDAQ